MRYFRKRLPIAAEIIRRYRAPEPFHLHLKKCFKEQKKFGSRDRRELRDLCYSYWRVGVFTKGSIEEQLSFGWLILNVNSASDMEERWSDNENKIIDTMANIPTASMYRSVIEHDIFDADKFKQYSDLLSPKVDQEVYFQGLFTQPNTWIRVRADLDQLLGTFQAEYEPVDIAGNAIAFEAATPLDKLPSGVQKQFVIQDIASQEAINMIHVNPGSKVWDVCCGAGGKSLALLDRMPDLDLCASDIRPGILRQLKDRLGSLGHRDFSVSQFDATKEAEKLEFIRVRSGANRTEQKQSFDYVLCDVPCSGSGTWSRTPEDHVHFDATKLEAYTSRQYEILQNASHFVKEGGELWYMTCSVFGQENEEIAERFARESETFTLVGSGYCDYLSKGGDCLFYAQFSSRSTQL